MRQKKIGTLTYFGGSGPYRKSADGRRFPVIRGGEGDDDFVSVVNQLNEKIDDLVEDERGESRYATQYASEAGAKAIAARGWALAERGGGRRETKAVPGYSAKAGALIGAMTKALAEATASAGGYLVPPEVATDVLQLLRARSAVLALGPTRIEVEKQLLINSMSSGASASYVAENLPIPVSEQTFAQAVLLEPKELGALVPVSLRLLRDAAENPSVEDVVKADIAEVMALRADLAFIAGTGSGQPLGILSHSGLTAGPSLGANGRAPTFDDLRGMPAALRALNAPFLRPGWLFHSRLLSTLELLKDTNGRYLADTGLLAFDETGAGGRLLGYPFRTTSQISITQTTGTSTDTTSVVFSSDWQEAFIGENQTLSLEASMEASYVDLSSNWHSAFQERQALFRALAAHDFKIRRPQLFVVMSGVRP